MTRYAATTSVSSEHRRAEIERTLRRYGHLIKFHPHGCWEWRGVIDANGYGVASVSKTKKARAHRLIYEAFRGAIPEGLDLDHRCHGSLCPGGPICPHRRCVNPAHLAPASRQENLARGVHPTAAAARAGTCVRGHEMTLANTYVSPRGQRQCRTCRKMRDAERARRRSGGGR